MSILSGILSGADDNVFDGTFLFSTGGSMPVEVTIEFAVSKRLTGHTMWYLHRYDTSALMQLLLWSEIEKLSRGEGVLVNLEPRRERQPAGRLTFDEQSQAKLRVWMDRELEEGRAP